jgi:hypothetical protein
MDDWIYDQEELNGEAHTGTRSEERPHNVPLNRPPPTRSTLAPLVESEEESLDSNPPSTPLRAAPSQLSVESPQLTQKEQWEKILNSPSYQQKMERDKKKQHTKHKKVDNDYVSE